MSTSILYMIRWNSFSAKPYLYGTDLRYLQNGAVQFENEMMPPGAVINEWSSKTSFQRDRKEPQLPVLSERKTYRYFAHYSEWPAGTILIRIDFFDIQNRRLEFKISEKKTDLFTLPKGTHSYTFQLIQGGARKIMFYDLEIVEEQDPVFQGICRKSKSAECLNILIPQVRGSLLYIPEAHQRYSDQIGLSLDILKYSHRQQRRILDRLIQGYPAVTIRYNGERGERAAHMVAELLSETHVTVSIKQINEETEQ